MNWLGSAGLFVLGACVGSFLNVVADRLPAGESLLHPPSHCPACGRQLAKRELVPIVGWLALRGRCRTCTAPIPLRVPTVELTTALVFVAAGWLISPWPRLVFTMGFASLLIAIAAIDLEHQVVPNRLVYPALALALAAALLPWPP
ncbi:MAG TPA: prepilin peptidase, partial [Anaerolineales bacterium]